MEIGLKPVSFNWRTDTITLRNATHGALAERRGNGLQNRSDRFDSGRCLTTRLRIDVRMFTFDFATSDSHFGHINIIKYAERPFSDVAQMDAEMVRRWNTVVRPTDVVVHLGDLALGQLDRTLPRTAGLNGTRYLIPGNHDRVSSVNQGGRNIERFRAAYEDAGWTILDEVVEAELGGHRLLLSHFPYVVDSHDKSGEGVDRYSNVRPVDIGLPLVHGHVHQAFARRGHEFNAGVDIHHFAPVSAKVIAEWMIPDWIDTVPNLPHRNPAGVPPGSLFDLTSSSAPAVASTPTQGI